MWLCVLQIAALAACGVAETVLEQSIDVDTHLNVSGSPYISHNDVVVNQGATLTVKARVTLKFAAGKGIDVYGTLISAGEPDNPVLFTALNDPKDNQFNSSGSTVRFLVTDPPDKGMMLSSTSIIKLKLTCQLYTLSKLCHFINSQLFIIILRPYR